MNEIWFYFRPNSRLKKATVLKWFQHIEMFSWPAPNIISWSREPVSSRRSSEKKSREYQIFARTVIFFWKFLLWFNLFPWKQTYLFEMAGYKKATKGYNLYCEPKIKSCLWDWARAQAFSSLRVSSECEAKAWRVSSSSAAAASLVSSQAK